jgi:hypothetical protein
LFERIGAALEDTRKSPEDRRLRFVKDDAAIAPFGETESAQQNRFETEIEFLAQGADGAMVAIDQLAAEFAMKWCDWRVPCRPDAAAETVSRFEDADSGAAARKLASGGQAGEAGAGDDDAKTT